MAYSYVENKINNISGVKILDGIYSGLVVSYGKLKFNKDELIDKMYVSFEYSVHQEPNNCPDGWEDGDLVDYLGNILMEILDDKLDDGNITDYIGIDSDD